MLIGEIATNIEQRLLRAADEVAQLERARDVLTDAPSPEPAPESPTRRRTQTGTTQKRSSTTKRVSEAVPLPKLIALLAESEGLSTRELATHTGGSSAQILRLLKVQEATGDVRRDGTGAATRWHLLTDEDRIAARAAELTAQRNSKS
jgi:ribosome-binding protein aMBF1 (putative translation factor)